MADSNAPTRKIQVANSRPEDSGRGLAHLPRTLMAALGITEGDVVEIRTDGYRIVDADGADAVRPVIKSQLSADSIELGRHSHYMQKEIFEQPRTVENALRGRTDHEEATGTSTTGSSSSATRSRA